MVGLQSLLCDSLLLLVILLFITAEKVDIILIISLAGSSCSTTGVRRSILGGLGELLHTCSKGLDVVVPSEGVRGVRLGSSRESLKDSSVSLTWNISFNVTVFCKKLVQSLDTSSRLEISKHLDM